jgi:hypothetical protein
MRQLYTFLLLTIQQSLAACCLFVFSQCRPDAVCGSLEGAWSERDGQIFVFQNDGSGLWLTRFGSRADTVRFRYRLDCKQKPVALDFTDFESGPHTGKMLLGIVEWLSDSSFRMRHEQGIQSDARPKDFDDEQTLKLFRTGS